MAESGPTPQRVFCISVFELFYKFIANTRVSSLFFPYWKQENNINPSESKVFTGFIMNKNLGILITVKGTLVPLVPQSPQRYKNASQFFPRRNSQTFPVLSLLRLLSLESRDQLFARKKWINFWSDPKSGGPRVDPSDPLVISHRSIIAKMGNHKWPLSVIFKLIYSLKI